MLGRYRGELFCLLGSLCFAFSGTVAKILLLSGLSPWRLTQVRCAGALVLLVPVMLWSRGSSLRIARADLARMVVFGVVGVAVVQALYFVAIARVSIGIALLLEFTAPVWILLYLRFWKGVAVPQGLWLALGLSLSGLLLITEAWQGLRLDAVGVAAGLLDAPDGRGRQHVGGAAASDAASFPRHNQRIRCTPQQCNRHLVGSTSGFPGDRRAQRSAQGFRGRPHQA